MPPIRSFGRMGGMSQMPPPPATASGERSLADVIGAVSLGSLRDAPMHRTIPRRDKTRNLLRDRRCLSC